MSGKFRNVLTWSDGILSMLSIVVHAISGIAAKVDDVRNETSSNRKDEEE
ncbi:MAG: hypothetical protein IJI45_13885 [Anaerolineaceae bacterium]|nr:hypothetical protein [Anaerolineaceae bacterium]